MLRFARRFTLLGALFLAPFAQAEEQIDVRDFFMDRYTSNYTKSVEANFRLSIVNSGEKSEALFVFKQTTGKREKKFNREWIVVEQTSEFQQNGEITKKTGGQLIDPASQDTIYTVDDEDESFSFYQWNYKSTLIPLGQQVLVGKVQEKKKNGTLISVGDVKWRVTKSKIGYEVCQLELVTIVETKARGSTLDCNIFDNSKKILSSRIELTLADGVAAQGAGELRLK